MKKKNETKGLVPLTEQPQHVNVEKNVVVESESVLSVLNKLIAMIIQRFMVPDIEKMNFSSMEDIEQNSKLIDEIEFHITFFNPALISLLKSENKRLSQMIPVKTNTKSKAPKSNEQIQDPEPENMAMINGGVMEFGLFFGNIFENLQNKAGNRLIEADNTTLAKILASNFKFIDGSALNIKSLAVYIGQGRKMKSIIDPDVLKELLKKKD